MLAFIDIRVTIIYYYIVTQIARKTVKKLMKTWFLCKNGGIANENCRNHSGI